MTASQAAVGEVLSVPLCEGGESIMVTEENRREFVELYVDYILNKSVETQVCLQSNTTNQSYILSCSSLDPYPAFVQWPTNQKV